MNFVYTACEKYHLLSTQYYEGYKSCRKELDRICGGTNTFDRASHTSNENQDFDNFRFSVESYAISSIVFQALAVEAFINFYGVKRLGEKKFKEHYDKIGTLDKIVIILKVSTGHDFPKSNNTYAKLKKLFQLRNKLVHFKSKEIDLMNSSSDEFFEFMNNSVEFYIEDLDRVMTTYTELKELIRKIENSEEDVFWEQENELSMNINKTMNEMFQQAFGIAYKKDIT